MGRKENGICSGWMDGENLSTLMFELRRAFPYDLTALACRFSRGDGGKNWIYYFLFFLFQSMRQ